MKLEPLLDPKEVAHLLGVSVSTVYRLARIRVSGEGRRLQARAIGRSLRFVAADVARFIDQARNPLPRRRRRR